MSHYQIVEEYTPPPVEQFAEVVEEQVWEEPLRRVGGSGTTCRKSRSRHASGNVSDLRLFSSSGHSILDKAAFSSVRGWRFKPGTVSGRQKAMWVKVPVRFELN